MKKSIIRYTKYTLGLLALIFALSPLLNHSFVNTASAQQSSPPANVGLSKDHPVFQNAIAVQNKHSQRLMNMQGVHGTGVGIGPDGLPVIKIYLESAGVANIPEMLDHIPVQVEVTGMIVAFTDPTTRQSRPVPIGVSSGHPNITAGTIGARVKDSSDNVYALSNNHVYADNNEANILDNILQPGTYDGGSESNDVIGQLSDYEPIDFSGGDNLMDAAIAMSDATLLNNSTPADDGYGTPNSMTMAVTADMPVQKYGRTTGLTKGAVQEINVLVDVCYEVNCRGPFRCTCTKEARFINQFSVEDEDGNSNTSFSAGGDSGSLIVTDDENKNPVGLLFAGNSSTGYTFASPIVPILTEFGVTIDGTIDPLNNSPSITISSPLDGANFSSGADIAFSGSASDAEDGDISANLIWESDLDGQIGTESSFSTSLSDGTHTITASVTDSDSNQGSENITIGVGLPENQAPTAGFTYNCTYLECTFTDSSTDADGSIESWLWDFGDGNSTAQNPTHTFGTDGTYSVSLTVTDDGGMTNTSTQNVTVEAAPDGGITLSVTTSKIRGTKYADLNWLGTSLSGSVEVYRNGGLPTTTDDDGHYKDETLGKGGGTYSYYVCKADDCSNTVTVEF